MCDSFRKAIAEASKLPEAEQETLGALLLAEIESIRQWDDLFCEVARHSRGDGSGSSSRG